MANLQNLRSSSGDADVSATAADRQPSSAAPWVAGDRSVTSRPQRWDVPFGDAMSEEIVEAMMNVPPFAQMDEARFPSACPLRKILLNDTRLRVFEPGDVVVVEGDYGNSAFFVMSGSVRVSLDALASQTLGASAPPRKSFWQATSQLWSNRRHRESRRVARIASADDAVGMRQVDGEPRIFLQDVPGVLDEHRTLKLGKGEFFGEMAALARTPRTATVFADVSSMLLEIRWQGLRDIMQRDPALKQHIHFVYRQNSLESHLRETPFLKHLTAADIRRVADETTFESYGDFAWQRSFQQSEPLEASEKIQREPLICEEGHYTNGILLIRSGFARLSHRWGSGHRTVSYLGKGQSFGLAELAYANGTGKRVPLQHSLRAMGYVDALFLPSSIVEDLILPSLDAEHVRGLARQVEARLASEAEASPETTALSDVEPGLMEFIAEHRLMNGTETMMIDLDRCVRCDDCVRACATAHDNNPRFTRHGPRYGRYQFPHACMHCVDPVCLIGCPTGAIARDATSGNILINDLTCVGCQTCAQSCPYDNIQMVQITDQQGVPFYDSDTQLPILKATKCDLCHTQWGGPACQRACAHDALIRIDMSDLDAVKSWITR